MSDPILAKLDEVKAKVEGLRQKDWPVRGVEALAMLHHTVFPKIEKLIRAYKRFWDAINAGDPVNPGWVLQEREDALATLHAAEKGFCEGSTP